MHFLLYSRINLGTIGGALGAPEYSYYFLLKEFRSAFERLGGVTVIDDPATHADRIYDRCRAEGQECVLIAFTAPHNLPQTRRCPVIPVFAWEFERIPDEAWGDNPRNDWRLPLAECGRAITLSAHAVDAVRASMGPDYPVLAVPVPLWERMESVRQRCAAGRSDEACEIVVEGAVVDSRDYEISPVSLLSRHPDVSYAMEPWDGTERSLDFRVGSPDTGALGGFYTAEPWGSWSRNAEVWVALPWLLDGDVSVELVIGAYGRNIGRRLLVGLGDCFQVLRVGGGEELHRLDFRLSQPARMLQVSGLDVSKRGDTVDERTLGIGLSTLTVRRTGEPGPQVPVRLDLRAGSPDTALLHGFSVPEPWGTWSVSKAPWVMLPRAVQGRLSLHLDIEADGANRNVPLTLYLGAEERTVCLSARNQQVQIDFDLREPAQALGFLGVRLEPVTDSGDTRTLGIGLRSVAIDEHDSLDAVAQRPGRSRVRQLLALEGTVYMSVLNPCDDRKNWPLLISAFCAAFAEEPGATLVLKMTHHLQRSYLFELHNVLQHLPAFACRVVVVHGFLPDEEYGRLVERCDYYVNVSKAEGLCIPLMEFMSCGKPAIAPRHTSMGDYLDDSNSIAIPAGVEPCIWPHDPREVLRTLQYRVGWESVVSALRHSIELFRSDRARYLSMGEAAMRTMQGYCTLEHVTGQIGRFLRETANVAPCAEPAAHAPGELEAVR